MKRIRSMFQQPHVDFVDVKCFKIVNPMMIRLDSRIRSYSNCNYKDYLDVKELSKCGYYFSQSLSKVLCFYCGTHLNLIRSECNQWLEHALASPKCPFILLQKHKSSEIVNPSLDIDRILSKLEDVENLNIINRSGNNHQ
jgi:ribosomal protein S27E